MKHWTYCKNCGYEFQFDDLDDIVQKYDQTQCPECELTVGCDMNKRWGIEE